MPEHGVDADAVRRRQLDEVVHARREGMGRSEVPGVAVQPQVDQNGAPFRSRANEVAGERGPVSACPENAVEDEQSPGRVVIAYENVVKQR